MPRYTVHVTLTFPGWIEIDADTALEAEDQARALSANLFDYDPNAPEVDYAVTPYAVVA